MTGEKEIANNLNVYFVDKVKKLKDNIDKSKIVDPLVQLKNKMANSNLNFELKTVTVQSVRKIMGKMRMKKSAGPDEISQECLLLGKSVIAGPLTTIINASIYTYIHDQMIIQIQDIL